MKQEQVHIIIERSDGSLVPMSFQCVMRSPRLPAAGGWQTDGAYFTRLPTPENIQYEIDRAAASWAVDGVQAVSWRLARAGEVQQFESHRIFRDALRQTGDRIEHHMPAARDCARREMRRRRAHAMPGLDAQWMRATGRGDKKAAAAVEAERQRWRDAPADPRIEAAPDVAALTALLP